MWVKLRVRYSPMALITRGFADVDGGCARVSANEGRGADANKIKKINKEIKKSGSKRSHC